MHGVARVTDRTTGTYSSSHCTHKEYDDDGDYTGKEHNGGTISGIITSGSHNVFIGGLAVACVGDSVDETTSPSCSTGTGRISTGSSTVFVNNKNLSFVTSKVKTHADTTGSITTGSTDVYVGR